MANQIHIKKTSVGSDIAFRINNPRIDLTQVIDHNIMNVIYLVNKQDLFEHYSQDTSCISDPDNQTNTEVSLIFKNLFKDCGLPQYYMNMQLHTKTHADNIVYRGKINHTLSAPMHPGTGLPMSAAISVPIDTINIQCTFSSIHSAECRASLIFKAGYDVPEYQEKAVTMVFKKMFKNVKGFIETSI